MTLLTHSKQKANMPDLNEFISTERAAEILSLHAVTVRNMIRTKKLEGVKIGGKTWLVSKKSVEKYRVETMTT